MEEDAAVGNIGNFYHLIRNTNPRKPSVKEVVKELDIRLIHFQHSLMERCAVNLRT